MLKHYDMSQFRKRALDCADVGDCPNAMADEEYLLRFWDGNKSEYLYDLLGGELIVDKTFTYNRTNSQLCEDMRMMCNKHTDFVSALLNRLETALRPKWSLSNPYDGDCLFYNTVTSMLNTSSLITGRVPNNASAVLMGKEIQLTLGQKSMRALGRIASLLNMDEQFEEFRIAHSQVLNQRTVQGDLHLSIHPLDFSTASDNHNGWSSCMSWDSNGCYRLGTVEMMNSPMVLCAYMTGKNIMGDVGGGEWNSKKWRAWVIVHKDIILVNRQYPYHNDEIAGTVVEWVKELAKKNLGWEYQEVNYDMDFSDRGFQFECNYMYNDVGCECHAGAYGAHITDQYAHRLINFSGPAVCMYCGEKISYIGMDDAANTLCCDDCRDSVRCTCCGMAIDPEEVCWTEGGQPYCCECYNENFSHCDLCGGEELNENTTFLEMGVDSELLDSLIRAEGPNSAIYNWNRNHWGFNRNELVSMPEQLTITICDGCLMSNGIDKNEGILYDVQMPFDHYKHTYWNGTSQYDYVCAALNPLVVGFGQFVQTFNAYPLYADTDGSFERVWRKVWADYTRRLIEHGIIEV